MAGKGGKGLLATKTTAAASKDKDKEKDKKRPVSRSSRAGIQFPVGRIHRHLKQRIASHGREQGSESEKNHTKASSAGH
ncbi:hypothetical protein OIU76_001549 [Salix suchowensis]|nr:hypothetical protein OIU78_021822 [Salix suchowensis]KAJ6352351.1 hypothetical protein OIU76_001549 [Salix suchowensis]